MSRNYFEIFGLPERFELDPRDLTQRYQELVRTCHPDRFAQASAQERRIAVETTANLNDALKTLRDPVHRARYLLSLRGVETDEENDTVMDAEFLAEQMAWRERLEENGKEPAQVEALIKELATLEGHKEEALRGYLASTQEESLQHARRLVRELQFLRRFKEELNHAHIGV